MFANQDKFTIEEVNLMCVFDTNTRPALLADISAATSGFDEPELVEIAERTIKTLITMTDDEFSELELYPEYGDYNEESEA
jgi:hypothetical protein